MSIQIKVITMSHHPDKYNRNITIIFLLAVGLLNSIAPPICFANRSSGTKSASVLLQEGLYAEQVDGDLDAAIRIYEQVIAEAKETQRAAAQATYRIGMCYLKKGEKQKAAEQFRNLISKFPEHESLVINAGKQLAKLKPIGGFAPVIERVVNDDGERKNILIDLDSGELFSAPRNLRSKEERQRWKEERQRWFVEKGIDAGCETNPAGPGLYGLDMVVIPIGEQYWETVKPGMLRSELASGKPGSPAVMSGLGQLPASYMFKTREGGMGALQILEVRNDVKPSHIRIRYKMLQKESAGRIVFLPDADSRDVDVVLDLASGELLPAGEGEKQLIGDLCRTGQRRFGLRPLHNLPARCCSKASQER